MQKSERAQEQVDDPKAAAAERLSAATLQQRVTQERKDASERELTKYRALSEVLAIGEQSLLAHRAQLVKSEQPPAQCVVEGLDAALEELRRLQRQTQDYALKNEGALNALSALEEVFSQHAAQNAARVLQLEAVVASRGPALSEPNLLPPPPTAEEEDEDDAMAILGGLGAEDDANEPIAEPRRGAARKPK